jgi:hypothetical protein
LPLPPKVATGAVSVSERTSGEFVGAFSESYPAHLQSGSDCHRHEVHRGLPRVGPGVRNASCPQDPRPAISEGTHATHRGRRCIALALSSGSPVIRSTGVTSHPWCVRRDSIETRATAPSRTVRWRQMRRRRLPALGDDALQRSEHCPIGLRLLWILQRGLPLPRGTTAGCSCGR